MGLNSIVFLCLMVATVWMASSNPVPTRVTVVKLTNAQSKQAVSDLKDLLQKVVKKLEDAEVAHSRRDTEEEGLEVAVEAPEFVDLTGDDIVNYLDEAAKEADDFDDVERRDLTGGLTYDKANGWGANAGYTYTSPSGNTKFNVGGSWSQRGGWGAGIGFSMKF